MQAHWHQLRIDSMHLRACVHSRFAQVLACVSLRRFQWSLFAVPNDLTGTSYHPCHETLCVEMTRALLLRLQIVLLQSHWRLCSHLCAELGRQKLAHLAWQRDDAEVSGWPQAGADYCFLSESRCKGRVSLHLLLELMRHLQGL